MGVIKHMGTANGATAGGFTAATTNLVGDSAAAFYGSLGYSATNPTTAATGRDTVTGATKLEAVGYVRLSAAPTADFDHLRLTENGDTVNSAIVRTVNPGATTGAQNRFRLVGVGGATLWESAAVMQYGPWIRIGCYFDAGTSATTGRARLAFFLRDSNTPLDDSGLLTGVNVADAIASFGMTRIGMTSSPAYTGKLSLSHYFIKTDADATQDFAPFQVSVALDKTSGSLPYTLGATVNVDGGSGVNRTHALAWGDGTTTGLDANGRPAQASPNFSKSVTGSASFTGRVPVATVSEDPMAA